MATVTVVHPRGETTRSVSSLTELNTYVINRGWSLQSGTYGDAYLTLTGSSYMAPVIEPQGAALGVSRSAAARIGGIGESTTVANSNGTATALSTQIGDNYLAHLCAASAGRLICAGVMGQVGITSAQLLASVLPNFLALPAAVRPGRCIVLTGINDAAANTPLPTTGANITAICDQLQAAGIEPILSTVLPVSNTPTARNGGRRISAWISAFGARRGIRVLDGYGPLVDPATGDYAAGLDDQTNPTGGKVHPNRAGYRVLGQSFAQQLASSGPEFSLTVPRTPVDALDVFTGSGFFAVDTNADGVGNGWANYGSGTYTRALRAGVGGYVTRVTNGGPLIELQKFDANLGGHRVAFTGRVWTSGFEAAGNAEMNITLADQTGVFVAAPIQLKTDVTDARFYAEAVVPAGANPLKLGVSGQVPGAVFFEVAEVSCMDLTALGVA